MKLVCQVCPMQLEVQRCRVPVFVSVSDTLALGLSWQIKYRTIAFRGRAWEFTLLPTKVRKKDPVRNPEGSPSPCMPQDPGCSPPATSRPGSGTASSGEVVAMTVRNWDNVNCPITLIFFLITKVTNLLPVKKKKKNYYKYRSRTESESPLQSHLQKQSALIDGLCFLLILPPPKRFTTRDRACALLQLIFCFNLTLHTPWASSF